MTSRAWVHEPSFGSSLGQIELEFNFAKPDEPQAELKLNTSSRAEFRAKQARAWFGQIHHWS